MKFDLLFFSSERNGISFFGREQYICRFNEQIKDLELVYISKAQGKYKKSFGSPLYTHTERNCYITINQQRRTVSTHMIRD
jgi:hypothetical protein